jgi:hypothetical protein
VVSRVPAPPSRKAQRVQNRVNRGVDSGSIVLPRNEQDRMMRVVNSGQGPVSEYLATLMFPKLHASRVPDSFARPTALVRSIASFSLPVFFDPASLDAGRFSMALQPWIGSTVTPNQYKFGIANTEAGNWSGLDWTSPLSYINNVEGSDPRVDPFFTNLTQPNLGDYSLTNLAGGVSPIPFPMAASAPWENGSTSWFHFDTPGIKMQFTNTLGNEWLIGPGQYNVQFFASTADTITLTTFSVVSANTGDAQKDAVAGSQSPDGKRTLYYTKLTVHNTVRMRLTVTTTTPGAALTNATISISPVYFSAATQGGSAPIAVNVNSVPSGNHGVIQQYRTVGMSILVTYTGPLLTNGGTIAGCYVPGTALQENFYSNSPLSSVGGLQNWENLAKVPGSFSGQLKDGIYGWWSPEDVEGYIMKSPDSALLGHPPSLVVSGQYAPGNISVPQTVYIARVEVNTIYEFMTETTLWPAKQLAGSTQYVDMAQMLLADQAHFMPNAEHMSWFKDFWGGVKEGVGYVKKGLEIAMPIISML